MITVNGTGGAEKVTIDGEKAKEKIDLYSYSWAYITKNEDFSVPTGPGTQYYLKNQNILYVNKNDNMFTIYFALKDKPFDIISNTTITINNTNYKDYDLYQDNSGDIWFIIKRTNKPYYYFDIYKIIIEDNIITYTVKAIDIQTANEIWGYDASYIKSIVNKNGIYISEFISKGTNNPHLSERYFQITFYQFGKEEKVFQNTSSTSYFTGSTSATGMYNYQHQFIELNNNIYFFYPETYRSGTYTMQKYVELIPQSDGSFLSQECEFSKEKNVFYLFTYDNELYGEGQGCISHLDFNQNKWTVVKDFVGPNLFEARDYYDVRISINNTIRLIEALKTPYGGQERNRFVFALFTDSSPLNMQIISSPELDTFYGYKNYYKLQYWEIKNNQLYLYVNSHINIDEENYIEVEEKIISNIDGTPIIFSTI